jgi:dTDP-4-amino-4,6-dideoxygalactose transaminase
MSNPFRPISISLSPNTEKDDIKLAWKLLFESDAWVEGKAVKELEVVFKEKTGVKHAFSFNSGRSALMAVFNALELEIGSEVLLQAFTCNAAVNPVIWAGLKPVYVDCNNNYNIDVEDLRKKITPKSRAVMVQHTFGQPCDLDEVIAFCREKKLVLIEDCAHSLGAVYKGKNVGTFGDVSFFSFSRDKIVSCVYGGMAATKDKELAEKIATFQKESGYPGRMWIEQQLLHPVLMNWVILPTYSVFGKYLLVLFQQTRILSKAIHWKEKRGRKPDYFPKRLPNALALLCLKQLEKLERFNAHRQELAAFYYCDLADTTLSMPPKAGEGSHSVYLRFTVRDKDAREIIDEAWHRNLLIGDWYTSPVVPNDTQLDKLEYVAGSCPNAERLARETFNLPTHINITNKDAKTLSDFIKLYDKKNN